MTKRSLAGILRLAVIASLCAAPASTEPAADSGKKEYPPRIILVTVDTLRADHLPMWGYRRNTSPFLASLAEKGILYERTFSACSQTAPCHASVFTSLNPDEHGLLKNGQKITTDAPTMAEIMKSKGYATGAFASVAFLSEAVRGFDKRDVPKSTWKNPRKGKDVVDQALSWLSTLPKDKKVFMWVHLYDVHNSYELDREHTYQSSARELAADKNGVPEKELRAYWMKTFGLTNDQMDRKLGRRLRAYDARIRYADHEVSRLYESLTKPGSPGSVWVVTSDHGEGLGNHGYLDHDAAIYEEQTHVPLIINFSDGRYGGTRVKEMARHVDILPTLIRGMGLPHADLWEGVPLWPIGDRRESNPAFISRRPENSKENWKYDRLYAIRGDKWKILWSPEARNAPVLYDLETDPRETKNVAEQYPDEAKQMAEYVGEKVQAMRKRAPTKENPIAPEHMEELKSLGYLQ